AHRHEPGGQRRLQHIAGEPRVLADHDQVLMRAVAKTLADRHGDLERRLRRHRLAVCGAADAIRPEKLARHRAGTSKPIRPPQLQCGPGLPQSRKTATRLLRAAINPLSLNAPVWSAEL